MFGKKKEKTQMLRINEKLHREIKIHCARNDVSIKDFTERVLWSELDKTGK